MSRGDHRILLGVDTGGTFTDFVLLESGRLRVHKVLSTPARPEEAILEGVAALGVADRAPALVHGSTVATNAVLEGRGVSTVFITNRGFADLLTIARQDRERLYDLQPPPVAPPLPPEACLETGGRLAADGAVLEPLTDDDLAGLEQKVGEARPRGVAVCLLHAFLDGRFERRIAERLPPDCFVALSCEVLPEVGEYERAVATWLNAYVGPLMAGYLGELGERLPGSRIAVMQSDGRTVSADQAGRRAVHLLLSGPAGGLAGARHVGAASGAGRLMTLDMGGTSTDVALIDGDIRLTTEGRIGRYPVGVPMVDMHTIGAGGGSIARVDAGGLLNVGPESAGAEPGPACYGAGGRMATVTDANVVLGRLPADTALGGGMALDRDAAVAALDRLGGDMGMDAVGAAQGVIRLADEHMTRALRVISVERGHDPADFVLMSFGGAGGLHVCSLAERLGMRRALVPPHAGVLSALGMLVAPPGRELSAAWPALIDGADSSRLSATFRGLERQGRAELAAEGHEPEALEARRFADLRYKGQSFTITLPWTGAEEAREGFHEAHERQFGHRLVVSVELVNLRVSVTGRPPPVDLPQIPRREPGEPSSETRLAELGQTAAVFSGEVLAPGQTLAGPVVISEPVGTTYVPPGWLCRMTRVGALELEHTG